VAQLLEVWRVGFETIRPCHRELKGSAIRQNRTRLLLAGQTLTLQPDPGIQTQIDTAPNQLPELDRVRMLP
jgi:hypothetical protein